jgi:hypothetical protein
VSGPSKDSLYELLVQSLATWQVVGSVDRTASGELFIRAGVIEICIERAPKHLPFRWMVSAGGRKRGALSIVAVLRQVRAALDPGFVPNNRVRIAVSPSVPS